METSVRNQHGIALVITLLIVSLLTIIVVEFTFTAHVDSRMGHNALNSLQATLLARSAIDLGEAMLMTDKDLQFDSYLEDWGRIDELDTQLLVPENMQYRVRVVDEVGKLNINRTRPVNVSQCQQFLDQQPNSQPRMWLTALQRLDAQMAERANDYWTAVCEQIVQSQPAAGAPAPTRTPTGQPGGTATPDATPGTQDPTALLRDFPTLDDAAAQMGISTASVRSLRPFVTALPAGAAQRVNANTAPLRVLTAIIGDEGAAHDLVSRRQDAPLTQGDISQVASAAAAQTGEATTQPAQMLGVTSTYFLIRASAIVNANPTTGRGGIRRSASMLVQRRQSASPQGGSRTSGQGNPLHWTLTQLDWQKEGGAALFSEKREDEAGMDEGMDSEFAPTGG
jgi:type II secretory pathway component PulK